MIGGGFGLAIGGAYLAGGLANTAAERVQVAQLADAARQRFSPAALTERAQEMDSSVRTVALRHDRFASVDMEARRRGLLLVNRLGSSEDANALREQVDAIGPAAEPFQIAPAANHDLDCLTTAVYYEARGESQAGQQAVAQVILNRVRHPNYPRSICGVVYQRLSGRGGCQFSFACDGSMRRRREPGAWERARNVAERALGGFVMTAIGNATNFHTVNVAPGWRYMVRVSQIGTHIFYRMPGRAGSASAFNARPAPSSAPAGVTATSTPPAAPTSPPLGDTTTQTSSIAQTAPRAAVVLYPAPPQTQGQASPSQTTLNDPATSPVAPSAGATAS